MAQLYCKYYIIIIVVINVYSHARQSHCSILDNKIALNWISLIMYVGRLTKDLRYNY